jgi:hypothetical protein
MNFSVGACFNRADLGIEQRQIDAATYLPPRVFRILSLCLPLCH